MPAFLTAGNLKLFISQELIESTKSILFRNPKGSKAFWISMAVIGRSGYRVPVKALHPFPRWQDIGKIHPSGSTIELLRAGVN
jgi:hypothetical protein